jgi:hypothetical protein
MSEEIEKASGDKSEGKESKTLDQDDISKLIDEMQSEENSSETEDQTEKTTVDKTKHEPDKTKGEEIEGEEPKSLNQDDISKLVDEVQNEKKPSEADETEDTTEHVEKDNEGEKNAESEMPEDENMQTAESNDDNVKEKEIEEKAGSQVQDEISAGEDKKSEKKTDEKDKKEEKDEEDNGSFNGLDSGDEIEIDGDADTEPDAEKDKSDNKSKENDEDKDKRSKKNAGDGQAAIIKEGKKKFKGKRFKLLIACISSVVFIAVLLGVYTFFKKSEADIIKVEKPLQTKQIAKQKNKYSAKLEEITKLRNELLIKEKEIADLIKNYKKGISEIEDEILSVKQNNKIKSFSGAIKNKKIEFGMMTIKRRLAYIEKIDPPYKWLNQGIEELLYLKNKIKIDAQISSVISGIDMDKLIQEINIVIKSYRTGIEKLEINMKNVELMSLEMIWKRIIDKENFAAGNNEKADEPVGINKPTHTNAENNNRMIWEEICSGDFNRKNEMTKLSTQAAKCLSKWKHADLFLNGTSEFPPEVARYLLKWNGNWICLNGVKKLSPEAAKHLFQWQGNWISLNGIPEISSGLLKYLPQWQGKQLELMGLKYKGRKSERVGLKSLAKWEKSGGKLYIPVQIRKVINKL